MKEIMSEIAPFIGCVILAIVVIGGVINSLAIAAFIGKNIKALIKIHKDRQNRKMDEVNKRINYYLFKIVYDPCFCIYKVKYKSITGSWEFTTFDSTRSLLGARRKAAKASDMEREGDAARLFRIAPFLGSETMRMKDVSIE